MQGSHLYEANLSCLGKSRLITVREKGSKGFVEIKTERGPGVGITSPLSNCRAGEFFHPRGQKESLQQLRCREKATVLQEQYRFEDKGKKITSKAGHRGSHLKEQSGIIQTNVIDQDAWRSERNADPEKDFKTEDQIESSVSICLQDLPTS